MWFTKEACTVQKKTMFRKRSQSAKEAYVLHIYMSYIYVSYIYIYMCIYKYMHMYEYI